LFEHKIIAGEHMRNVQENGETVGFELQVRIPYYRGLALSMIHELEVTVDGESYSREDIRFAVATGSFTLNEMETAVNNRWEFGELAKLTVMKAGGLTEGEHDVEVVVHLRISYLPFIPARKGSKTLKVTS
jgi:hypothetical protein